MVVQQKAGLPFGVLVIHGFTATLESVTPLAPPLRELGIPVSMPLLTGHGCTSPEALRGVRWETWMADAERAFMVMAEEVERIIIIGHSMGALLALNLAARHRAKVDSLVLAAPALKLASLLAPGRPLHFLAPLVSRITGKWELKSDLPSRRQAGGHPHYPWVPTDAILSFFDLVRTTMALLGKVDVPVLILHNRKESTVLPESAALLCSGISTDPGERSVVWLERSGHQVFCDCEQEKAVRTIVDYVSRRIGH
ncbi:MAG: alpha/beta fold hydrolase [Chlorobiaceae bacterium]